MVIKKLQGYFKKLKNQRVELTLKAGYGWAWAEFMLGGLSFQEIEAYSCISFESDKEAFDQGVQLALIHMAKQFGFQTAFDVNTTPKVTYVPATPAGTVLFHLVSDSYEEAKTKLQEELLPMAYKSWEDIVRSGYTIETIVGYDAKSIET